MKGTDFGAHNEDLKHLLLWCPAYSNERGKITKLQQGVLVAE